MGAPEVARPGVDVSGACSHEAGHPLLENVIVLSNDRVAEGVGVIVLQSPRVAAAVRPGQFVHLRIAEGSDFILRRPFSVHRAEEGRIHILYQVLGPGTRVLSEKWQGDKMDLIGPLGHGWQVPNGVAHALLVAGGLGAAPLGMLAEELARRGIAVTVAHGAPTASRLVGRDVFEATARRVMTSTDDGSAGERGLVTTLVERALDAERPDVVYACGPEAMARIVAAHAAGADVPCQVSLERLMACGVGACLSCVVATTEGQRRACVEGPVFDAERVIWDATGIPPKHEESAWHL
ncbi:MAG: dihydroorotate dehydrogenase electron transfer subunit [Actinomycetia bacterium]|nr:dihydroorotate dehydrogenase electron transfer subunit [Actinomycetes bacterium]